MAAEWRFPAIGTEWAVTTPRPLPPELVARVQARIEDYDRSYSRFRADSLVSTLARTGGSAVFPDDWPALHEAYDRLGRLTAGAVTPLVGESLERLGYDAVYSLRASGPALPAPAGPDALEVHGRHVSLARPALIDVGAVGKGQLVDLVAELLGEAGIAEATVDAGGDLRRDGDAVTVALEHPYRRDEAIGVVPVGGSGRRAIAGSASNRRVWGDGLHHIIDGRTGEPVHEIVATWALAATALVADAAATALFFAPGPAVAAEFDVDWVRVFTDGRLEYAAALREGIFTS